MIRDEVVARCDVCDGVVTGGNPEQRQEVAEEFLRETATAMVGGYSVQICDDCLNSGRFQDSYGRHPVLGKHKVEAPALTTGARGQFPRHPRRNTRLRDNVIDMEGDPSADAGAQPVHWGEPDGINHPFNPEWKPSQR